jgi:hypothetical protein
MGQGADRGAGALNIAHPEPMLATPDDFAQRHVIKIRVVIWSLGLLLALGLFGRIMSFPLNHDEQIHVVAARMIFRAPLYGELGYNHLPGLPLLLGGFYAATGSDHLLQAGRVLIFLCWIATGIVTGLIAYRRTEDRMIVAVSILTLSAGALLGPPGMLVTNNFLPIPFALLGVHLFLIALEGDVPRPGPMFAAGVAIGFAVALKISFVFLLPPVAIAAMMVPRKLPLSLHIRQVLLPLLAGGLTGGLPVLVVLLSGPMELYEHTVRYFTGGHLAYWERSTQPKAISIASKLLVAEDVWLSGSGLLANLLIGVSGLLLFRSDRKALRQWQVMLVVALVACAALGSFLPTPAFPQYYEPPVPFLVLLFILIYARLDEEARRLMIPLLATTAILALTIILPRLLPGLPVVPRPSLWTGNMIHAQGLRIRATMDAAPIDGQIATLSPIVALEGDLPVYREFSAGPFVYRVADYLPQSDRRWFRTTSPRELNAFLDRNPPSAIVVGREPEFDGAFSAYARAHGYLVTETGDAQIQVFLRPFAPRH